MELAWKRLSHGMGFLAYPADRRDLPVRECAHEHASRPIHVLSPIPAGGGMLVCFAGRRSNTGHIACRLHADHLTRETELGRFHTGDTTGRSELSRFHTGDTTGGSELGRFHTSNTTGRNKQCRFPIRRHTRGAEPVDTQRSTSRAFGLGKAGQGGYGQAVASAGALR